MLRNQSIGATVAFGFASLLAIMATMVALAIYDVETTQRHRNLITEKLLIAEAADRLALFVTRTDAALRAHLLNPSPQELDIIRHSREQARQAAEVLRLARTSDAWERQLAEQVVQAAADFQTQAEVAERYLVAPGKESALSVERFYLRPTVDEVQRTTEALRARLMADAGTIRSGVSERGERLTQSLIVGFGLTGLVGVLLGIYFVRLVAEPVDRLVAAARAVEAGDYSMARRLGPAGAGTNPIRPAARQVQNEFALLEGTFSRMAEVLQEREAELRARTVSLTAANAQLSALQSLTDVGLSDLELDPLLEQLLHRVVAGLCAQAGAISLMESATDRLELRAQLGVQSDETAPQQLSLDPGLPDLIASTRGPVVVPEVDQDPRFDTPYFCGRSVRSLIAIPLQLQDQVIGLAHVDFLEPHAFDPPQLQLAALFGERVERAVERARAVAELEAWGRDLESRVAEQQERLLWSERLAAIGLLGGSIAHELRNPLGVISNSIYYLRHRSTPADEKSRRHLEIMEMEVAQATRIINNLVDFSVGVEPVRTRLDLNRIIGAAVDRARPPEEIRLEQNLDPNLPDVVGDEGQLVQVFEHLIRNAVQALEGAGRLRIRTGARDTLVFAEVQDDGPGVPRENQERIFEPLFSTRTKGIGLGLSLSRKILEAHGGWIRLHSDQGRGATFTIELPVTEGGAAQAGDQTARSAAAGRIH